MKNIKLKDIRILQSVSFIHWAATSTTLEVEVFNVKDLKRMAKSKVTG